MRTLAAVTVALFLAVCGDVPATTAARPVVQAWLGPDNDTPDLLDLFSDPQLWSNARAQISVLKLGPQQVGGSNPTHINTLADLSKVKAFQLLRSWGISLAIEVPSIVGRDCSTRNAVEYTLRLVRSVRAAGGIVRIASMADPLAAGKNACGDAFEDSAAKTAAYIKEVKASEPTLEIGDIEAYPLDRPVQLEQWVTELIRRGAKPAFFHLDANIHFLDVHPNIDVAGDLRSLKAFLKAQGIPFGIIFWSGYDPEPTDQAYFDRTMAWVRRVHAAIGAPDQAIFQSWIRRSYPGCADTDQSCNPPHPLRCPPSATGCGLKSVPVNLPEGNQAAFSLTRLANQALGTLRQ
jgi:hypothetical protein